VTVEIRAAVLIASDSRSAGERKDLVGPAAVAALGRIDVATDSVEIVPDDEETIARRLRILSLKEDISLILTSGGTGLSPRDVTPEATRRVVEKEVPGIPEMLRQKSAALTPMAALSRGVAGVLNRTLIINLPGSPKAVTESIAFLAPLLPHAVETLQGRAEECGRARS
jgi:molybdopterin adenylyltransferase